MSYCCIYCCGIHLKAIYSCNLRLQPHLPSHWLKSHTHQLIHSHLIDWLIDWKTLIQWTNSPFMGQQVHGVGNCKSFTLTHYLANPFAMHCGTRSIPLCIQHHIQLTALSFQVNWPYHSWDTAVSIFYLENPRSRSSGRSKFKVTTWFQHPIDSNPVFPMSICPPIPMKQIFSKFHLEIQGQGHNWRPHSRYNTLLTDIPFVCCQWAIAFLYTAI